MKKLKEIVLLFVSQVIVALIVYKLGELLTENTIDKTRNNLNWGITLKIATYTYLIIALLASIILSNIKTLKSSIVVLAVLYFIFLLLFANNYKYTPNKTLLLMLSSLGGLVVSFLLKKKINNKGVSQ